jgi:endonuclease/exonuclease/phosphatase family metal-dependent hydrolase
MRFLQQFGKGRRRPHVAAMVVVSTAAIVLSGAARWPTGHWEGGPIQPPAAAARPATIPVDGGGPTRLRLATFNVHSCIGQDKRWDVRRTAELLRGYDLVSLHEVRGTGPWWNDNARDMGETLGMGHVFSPTELWWWRPWFGNGILTRTRIDHWERNPLPSGFRDAYRNVLSLKVPFGSGSLNVLMVHLGKNENRRKQFPIVADMFLKLPPPAVLMGDTNTRPWDPMMRQLLAQPGVEDPVGCRMPDPSLDRVDFILVRGVKWRDAGYVENVASDHPVVWVEVEAP